MIKYIWIIMLLIAWIIWTLLTIKNIIFTVAKRIYDYESVKDFFVYTYDSLEDYAQWWLLIHLFILFLASLIVYIFTGSSAVE